jgi:AcrR family transcriptional regulator
MAVGDRPPPRAEYLVGLAEYERPRRSPAAGPTPPPRPPKPTSRERLLKAAISVFARRSFPATTITAIVDEAEAAPRTFSANFEAKDDCYRAVFDLAETRLRERLERTAERGGDWRERLRAVLAELLRFLGQEPDLARLLFVVARSAPPSEQHRRDELFVDLIGRLAVRVGLRVGDAPSPLVARFSLGAVEAVLCARLEDHESVKDEDLLPSLMYFAILPYLGHEVASEEGF